MVSNLIRDPCLGTTHLPGGEGAGSHQTLSHPAQQRGHTSTFGVIWGWILPQQVPLPQPLSLWDVGIPLLGRGTNGGCGGQPLLGGC